MSAKFDVQDLEDLMPVLLLARLDTSGVMDELKAAESILKVVDRHVDHAIEAAACEIERIHSDPDRVRPKKTNAEFATDLATDPEWCAQIVRSMKRSRT